MRDSGCRPSTSNACCTRLGVVMTTPVRLPAHEARRIGVFAQCDPRTVQRLIRGYDVRPLCTSRIIEALTALGMTELRSMIASRSPLHTSLKEGVPTEDR